jgi:hypothetical protein
MLSVGMLSVVMLGEFRYAECCYAVSHFIHYYVERHYANRR